MLELDQLVTTNRTFQLGPLTLEVGRGHTVLAGHNGAGKTTLMRCITGLQKPRAGAAFVGGFDPASHRGRRRAAAVTGYCPQGAALPARATVAQTLTFAGWLKGLSTKDATVAAERVAGDLDLVDHLGSPCGRLSGGTQQRVAIGQALVHDPLLLVLDEPSAGLDPVQRISLREVLHRIARDRAVLVSTHLVEDVEHTADRVIVLRSGRLVFDGTTHQLESSADQDAHGASDLERALWQLLSGTQ